MIEVERIVAAFFVLVGIAGSIVAATAEQGGSLVFGGGLAAVALAGVTVAFASLRKELKTMRGQLRECESKHDLMAWRFDVVLGVLHHHGAEVPDEVWTRKVDDGG